MSSFAAEMEEAGFDGGLAACCASLIEGLGLELHGELFEADGRRRVRLLAGVVQGAEGRPLMIGAAFSMEEAWALLYAFHAGVTVERRRVKP